MLTVERAIEEWMGNLQCCAIPGGHYGNMAVLCNRNDMSKLGGITIYLEEISGIFVCCSSLDTNSNITTKRVCLFSSCKIEVYN